MKNIILSLLIAFVLVPVFAFAKVTITTQPVMTCVPNPDYGTGGFQPRLLCTMPR